MGAGWIRGSPCSGDELHLVTVDKLLVGWVIGRLGHHVIASYLLGLLS